MKKRSISIIVASIVAFMIVFVVIEFRSKRPDKLGENPYKYDVDAYRLVDPDLIQYKETKNFPLKGFNAQGFTVHKNLIWLVGEGMMHAINMEGVSMVSKVLDGKGTAILVCDNEVYVSFEDHIEVFNILGEQTAVWEVPGLNCVFTSIAKKETTLYVADAGNRRVLRYNLDGELLGEFEGKAESNAGHGFIIPSANFDIAVNDFGELWVVNPGKHALENYGDDGELRGFWQNISMDIEGFSGCCNPGEIAILKDGSFVTSEKGLVRIKVYDPSGKLKCVVAAPSKFEKEGHAPEVAVDDDGRVFALDFDRGIVRVFEAVLSRQ